MKTLNSILILLLTVFLVVTPATVSAQSSTPPVATAQESTLQGPDVYPISLLGYTDQVMNGPYSYARIRFRLPDTWALNSGASIQLHIRNILTSTSGMTENELVQATGATLEVHFNSEWVTTLVLDWVGDKTITVPVPEDALATKTGQYTLSFYLDAGIDCNFDHQTTVVILADSVLDLQHDFVTPAVDLTLLPRPIYQQNSTLASPASSLVTAQDMGVTPAVIVVPDQPDQAELQAALIVSAGFGYLTNGNLVLNTVPVSQFTPEMKNNSQVILVGKAANLGILSEVTLPLNYSGAKFDSPDLAVEDGVIMEAVSPWNPLNVVLVVSSESDAGLVNAAKAVSSGFVQVGDRPDVAIVSGVTALPAGTSIPEVQTLADLGFATTQLSGLNYNLVDYVDFPFFVPSGMAVNDQAFIEVFYANSPLVDIENSGLTVFMNDITIGGIQYDENGDGSMRSENIAIPPYLLRPGMNILTIEASNQPPTYCSDMIFSNTWTTVYEQTALHLPMAPAETTERGLLTLGNVSTFLSAVPGLETVGFVIAPNSPAALDAASKIAFELGTGMIGEFVNLNATFADQLTDEFRQSQELILVGKAVEIPLLSELQEQLPAPFEENSNVASESSFRVVYKMPADTSLGYLELLAKPWNPEQSILAVLGTTDSGLGYAVNSLTISALRNQLSGDFAVVRNEQVRSTDTRYGAGTGNLSAPLVPEAVQETQVPEVTQSTPAQPLPIVNQTGWVLPAVAVSSALILLILLIVVLKSRKDRS